MRERRADSALQEGLAVYAKEQAMLQTTLHNHLKSLWSKPLAEMEASIEVAVVVAKEHHEEDEEDEDNDYGSDDDDDAAADEGAADIPVVAAASTTTTTTTM